ncbi:MAG: polysaccharide deacetylase family protein [Sinobacteraceae bacterium]|nr:polysaccharide deacetylase family protein [Nevskiaceae bacterium]
MADPELPLPTSRPWRPSALIVASALLHLAAIAVVTLRPHSWPWVLGILIIDHLLLTAAGLWPRSRLLGPNWTRLPGMGASPAAASVAITIDDGPDPIVTPRVLDVLDHYGARATFFCVGERVRQHAALAREIRARGHTIENHSQHHLHRFSILGPRAMAAEIVAAQTTIAAVVGEVPRFFRAPAGLRNPFLEPVLARLGLQLASWTRRGFDTVNTDPDIILRRLTRGLRAGDILLLHDGHAARTAQGEPVILAVLPRLLQQLAAAGLRTIALRGAMPSSVPPP